MVDAKRTLDFLNPFNNSNILLEAICCCDDNKAHKLYGYTAKILRKKNSYYRNNSFSGIHGFVLLEFLSKIRHAIICVISSQTRDLLINTRNYLIPIKQSKQVYFTHNGTSTLYSKSGGRSII